MVHRSPPATAKALQPVRLELTLARLILFSVVVAIPTLGAATGTPSPLAQIMVPPDGIGRTT